MNENVYAHIEKMDTATQVLLRSFLSNPSSDEWVRDVLLSYFDYFLGISEQDESDPVTIKSLRDALKPLAPAGRRRSLDKIEAFLYDEFRRKGYYFLGGMTGPHYGPYVWKRTEKRMFEVELPNGSEHVAVFFMVEFLLRSWMNFLTFGKQGTGGWVKRDDPLWDDGLYCVAEAYDIEHLDTDMIFQVSLLKHEAQHFADKKVFPGISSSDLEYRAKLVEIIYFPEMKYRFAPIIREASPLKTDPHRYSAHRILGELSARILDQKYVKDEDLWLSIAYEKIQAEAYSLLQEHTSRLQTGTPHRVS